MAVTPLSQNPREPGQIYSLMHLEHLVSRGGRLISGARPLNGPLRRKAMLSRLNQHYLTTKHPEKPTSCRTIISGNLRTPRGLKTIALAIGGVAAYGAYCIFSRPDSRAIVEADPSKKTLVVLGMKAQVHMEVQLLLAH